MKKILLAFGFLTILPLPLPDPAVTSEKEVGPSSAYFPLVGLVQGLFAFLLVLVLETLFPSPVVAALLVTVLITMSGALHLDGLSDTFDALASRGDREKMLAVMKDSRSGPFGVTVVVVVLILKILSLQYLVANKEALLFAVTLFPVAGKWSMVVALYHGKSARDEGLGRTFLEHTASPHLAVASAITAASFFLAAQGELFIPILVLLLVYLLTLLLVRFLQRRLQGLTGDTLGAINEINEVFFLLLTLALFA